MLSHCSLGAEQRLGIRDGRERPEEAWREESELSWNWVFLPGRLPATTADTQQADMTLASQARSLRCFTITQSRITSMSGLVRAMELSFPRQT